MRAYRPVAVLTLAVSLSGWHGAAVAAPRQSAPAAIDIQRLGPQVGERMPDFHLPDQTGAMRTVRSVMGPKGAMLVFFRSADW